MKTPYFTSVYTSTEFVGRNISNNQPEPWRDD